MTHIPKLSELILKIKRQETPLYAAMYRAARRARRFELPAPKALYLPLLAARQAMGASMDVVRSVALDQPMFRAACESCGPGLVLRGGFPYIHGDLRLRVGSRCSISGRAALAAGKRLDAPTLTIGDDSNLGWGVVISVSRSVTIGSRVRIAERCILLDNPGHPLDPERRARGEAVDPEQIKPVVIEDDVWIGARVTVLPGVTIGRASVIAAGSVVLHDIPPYTIAAGNPARPIAPLPGAPSPLNDAGPPVVRASPESIAIVRAAASEQLGLPRDVPLSLDASAVLGWDSLGHLALLTAIERAAQVSFAGSDYASLQSLDAISRELTRLRTPVYAEATTIQTAPARSAAPGPGPAYAPSTTVFIDTTPLEELVLAARRSPEKPALLAGSSALRYRELVERARARARLLAARGVSPGSRVLLLHSAKAEFVVSLYATWFARAVAVPLPADTPARELLALQRRAAAAAVLADVEAPEEFTAATRDDACAWLDARARSLTHADPAPPLQTPAPEDHALVLFTSGTTGARKGVLLSHRNLARVTFNLNARMGLDDSAREYVTLPLSHSFGLARVRCVLSAGGTLVMDDGHLDVARARAQIITHDCNAISWVPAGARMFLREPTTVAAIAPRIRWMELGSARLAAHEKRSLIERFPLARVLMHYGLTEASRSAFLDLRVDRERLDSVGRPPPGVSITIRDETGRPLPPGRRGEIVVEGAHVAVGYLDAQRPPPPAEGLRTGDVGWLDEDGFLYLLGRADDVINFGGVKITPAELEEPLRARFPGRELAVVGVEDPAGIAGELPAAVFVGHGEPLTLTSVQAAIAGDVPRAKLPRRVFSIDALPRTSNGKLARARLREQLRLSPPLRALEQTGS